MYSFAKKILFCLNPEIAHEVSMDALGAANRLHLLSPFIKKRISDPVEVMGLNFPNRIGLAAGLDKDGEYIDALGNMGFGFLEVGTVTPVAQPGNPTPRLFRLVEQQAIINRMGFNNKGVVNLNEKVSLRQYDGILGINIGKNKITPQECALSDYEKCMDVVYEQADYIAINISSPNTPGLRNLQFGENLKILLNGIKTKQLRLAEQHGKYVPVAVKIAPDMTDDELIAVVDEIAERKFDAVIATNTTITREGVEESRYKDEAGGLSGNPVRDKSTHVIKTIANHLNGALPIIGVGGVMNAAHAVEKLDAGASLVQIYTGFIFGGPALVTEAAEAMSGVKKSNE